MPPIARSLSTAALAFACLAGPAWARQPQAAPDTTLDAPREYDGPEWTIRIEPAIGLLAPAGDLRLPSSGPRGDEFELTDLNLDSARLAPIGRFTAARHRWRFTVSGLGFWTSDRGTTASAAGQIGAAPISAGDRIISDLSFESFDLTAAYRLSERPGLLYNIYLTQERLLRVCAQYDISPVAFSPLGALSYLELDMAGSEESLLENADVLRAAEAHGRTPAQVLLRWNIQRGCAVLPKSRRPERLRENLDLFDFTLAEDEMAAISALDRNRRFNDPGTFCEAAFNTFHPIYD